MNESGLDRLLDRSVPTVPGHLRTPPTVAIRRRARRRRTLVTSAATAGAVLALALASAVVTALPAARDAAVTPADPTAATDRTPLRWPLALVGRDDRTITVYPLPAEGECMELAGVTATFTSDADRVVVTARGDSRRAANCGESGAAVPVELTLPDPLAGRTLVDAATGRPAGTGLPRAGPSGRPAALAGESGDDPCAGRRPVRGLLQPARPTGPDHPRQPDRRGRTRRTTRRDHRDRRSHGRSRPPRPAWTLRWQAEGFTMTMNFSDDGEDLTRDRVLAVIGRLTW